MAEDNDEEPPYDINGKVIPFGGIKLKLLLIWIIICIQKINAKPETDNK